VDREDRWYFRLLVDKNLNQLKTLKPSRQTQYFISDPILSTIEEKDDVYIIKLELEKRFKISEVTLEFINIPN